MRTRAVFLLVCGLVAHLNAPARAQSVLRADEVVATGFTFPVYVTSARDGTGRLFVVEQIGRIRVIESGTVLAEPFLNLQGSITSTNEQGLLSVAFHPDYTTNGYFYVNYTDLAGATVVARYSVSADPNVADPTSAAILLRIVQPFGNHNGGQLQFGPNDGYLYIGMGDGGSGSDPLNHGQNINTLLGALLRIDVDAAFPYAIPPDNPFVGAPGADEIWAYGLRNPWRFSFDRDTGDLFLGDVGQATWEEIDFLPAAAPGGVNLGWVVREGPCPLGQQLPCAPAPAGFRDPIAYYGRNDGGSVTGGYLYRGVEHPSLEGRYLFGDFISGRVWSIRNLGASGWSPPLLELTTGYFVSSFGEDEEGEILIVDYFGGTVRKIRALDPPVVTNPAPGASLSGRQQSVEWDALETPVQEWWLYAGSSQGAKDYFDSGTLGSSVSAVMSGLPTNGTTVHVRLWYRVQGLWRYSDFEYLAANIPPGTPEITSPAPGSTLSASSAPFEWTDNFAPVAAWWLYAGSSPGSNSYFDSGPLGASTSVGVTGLPTDGSEVHVRLWYHLAGVWQFRDETYTAVTVGTPAVTSPPPGSVLSGGTVDFEWTANGEAVAEWWLFAGSVAGAADLFNSGSLGSSLETTVAGLPTDGSPIHVRLWYRIGPAWRFRDFAYTAASLVPAITSPPPGTTLAGSTVQFVWAANGATVSEYWLYVGSSPGARNHHDSGSLGTSTSKSVATLPTDGSTVHVRLWYRVGASWRFRDFQYTAALLLPVISSPSPGTTLSGTSVPFTWSDNGVSVGEWWLYAGSSLGARNYFDSGSLGLANGVTVVGLPANGSTVFVRLWYRVGGLWRFSDFQYTASS